jgi:hypothetical protein
MTQEALKLALEYIETNAHERRHVRWAIKEALAQLEQEPVGSVVRWLDGSLAHGWFSDPPPEGTLLYITPPAVQPQRQWVGLTLEEVQDSYNPDYQAQTRAVEAKLKEKNT